MDPVSTMSTLYVGDLHPAVTEVMLAEKFSPAGHIQSIRLCRDRNTGSSRGYAFINFQHRADAEQALNWLNNELLMERPMRVMWSQRDSTLRTTGKGNLFIKGLDRSIDSRALFNTFSAFGTVLSCKVVGNEMGSKGYGYVQFESPEAAERAMERLNGKKLNGRKVFIEHFKTRAQREAGVGSRSQPFTNICIKNLHEDVDDNKLRDIFSKFGPTLNVHVETDKNGKSKGFGFVKYERHGDAQRAVAEINRKMLYGVRVCVARALTKMERQAEESHRFNQPPSSIQNNIPENMLTYTPIQMVKPRPDLYWTTVRIIKPQYVQYISEEVQPAPVWQQTSGNMTPLSSEMPCTCDGCTSADTDSVADPVPFVEKCPPVESFPAVRALPAEECLPVVEETLSEESVPLVKTFPAEESIPVIDMVPSAESIPAVETGPAVKSIPEIKTAPAADSCPVVVQAPDEVSSTPVAASTSESELQQDQDTTAEPTYPPNGKQLTIYILESAAFDDQIKMAHDHLLPLVEKVHPEQADQITWMLVQSADNFKIMDMISVPEILQAKVDEMDALLKAREAGHKPETLKRLYNTNNKRRKKKRNE